MRSFLQWVIPFIGYKYWVLSSSEQYVNAALLEEHLRTRDTLNRLRMSNRPDIRL